MAKRITVIPARKRTTHSAGTKKKRLRVAAYCRVSTEQEEQQGSFKNQVEYYTNLINSNPDYSLAGIFSDDGISGTSTRKRPGFMAMIKACDDGNVDFLITKSISRFARNTADCLYFSRHLKNKGIPILFEKEGVNTMEASGELLFTILSSLAQEESRNISENVQWGIRSKFQKGIPHLNTESLLGYDKDENGNLVINNAQAEVVRRIYREFLEGWTPTEIAKRLNKEEVPGVHGKACWHTVSIERVLKNEKHCGDLLMQKTYTSDFLTKKMEENEGDLEQYFIKDDHPAIVDRETWEAVQMEMERRERFRTAHSLKKGSVTENPFFGRVFCGKCGGKYIRFNYKGIREPFWKCESTTPQAGKTGRKCDADRVMESELKMAVVKAWNSLVEKREDHRVRWERMSTSGSALEKHMGRMMLATTAEGKIECEVPEMTRMFLEEIRIQADGEIVVRFLDGSEVEYTPER